MVCLSQSEFSQIVFNVDISRIRTEHIQIEFTTVNMARKQNTACVIVFVCVLELSLLHAKIFSKARSDFRLFQEPLVNRNIDESFNRRRRDVNENTTFTTKSEHATVIHSQNTSLTSTVFALSGTNDNQVVVHWTGENNNVSGNMFIYWHFWLN